MNLDLSRYSPPIFDQGSEGSCVANAICGAIALQAKEYGLTVAPLSRQQLYNDIRSAEGHFDTDYGSVPWIAYLVAETQGIADESDMTYGPQNLYVHPSDSVHAKAVTQKVLSTTALDINQTYTTIQREISEQLMQGKAVLCSTIGLTLSDGTYIGSGHQFFIVGENDTTGQYKFQNSWNLSWGDHGYGYINYTEFAPKPDHTTSLLGLDVINGFKAVDNTWTAEELQAATFYAATFGRTGEHGGVVYWGSQLHNGMAVSDVLACFIGSSEYTSLYGVNLSNDAFVSAEYQHILGRNADSGGSAYWVGQLTNGVSRASEMATFIWSAQHGEPDYLGNRGLVSMNGAITFQDDGTHYQADVIALVGVTADPNTIQPALNALHDALFS